MNAEEYSRQARAKADAAHFRADTAARDMTINQTTDGNQDAPPAYYDVTVQPIDLIDAGQAAGMIGYYEGQIIKYVFRWRRKGGLRDLMAAAWLLNRMIAQEEQRGS